MANLIKNFFACIFLILQLILETFFEEFVEWFLVSLDLLNFEFYCLELLLLFLFLNFQLLKAIFHFESSLFSHLSTQLFFHQPLLTSHLCLILFHYLRTILRLLLHLAPAPVVFSQLLENLA